jgi:hypothetical protein
VWGRVPRIVVIGVVVVVRMEMAGYIVRSGGIEIAVNNVGGMG